MRNRHSRIDILNQRRDIWLSQGDHMIPVILSGGSGTRLWPISRAQYPKQFCRIFEDTLQNLTLRRVARLGTPWILTGKSLQNFTESQLRQAGLEKTKTIYEPMGRNTAPAIGLLIRLLEMESRLDEVVGIFAADALIEKEDEFIKAVKVAEKLAAEGQIVTLGIQPTSPETGYGYIQTARRQLNQGAAVLKFHEKPSLETAQKFLREGGYFWNAGMFIFKATTMKKAFSSLQPAMWQALQSLKSDLSNLTTVYEGLSSISIDYAIMEKLDASVLACVPCEIGWSDVGSWDAVAEISQHHERSTARQVSVGAEKNFVFSDSRTESGKTYSFVGVDDLIVVDTQDALLISKKGQSQNVKNIVEQLSKSASPLTKVHVYEDRPWGNFTILKDDSHFKSKVIQVLAGQQLSLQSHAKREEHWIVTRGHGEVVLNEQTLKVQAGTYIHIPLGAKHRMRNTGDVVLEFIEVQLGSYFGEDDIVRYQDDYRRS